MTKNQCGQILLVDDSSDQQILLRKLLELSGYTIDCTSNGAEALRLLNSCDTLPEVILLDLRMPIMDGATFRKKQMADPRLREIPVVLMTGDNEIEFARAETNSTDILVKPFDISSLLETVGRNFRKFSGAEASRFLNVTHH
jgi:CheY-like chemotaxis protein